MIPHIDGLKFKESSLFFLISGPCVVESRDLAFEVAEKIVTITDKYQLPYIFKASYKKANRSKLDSFTGIGDDEALSILADIKTTFNVPVITDVHSAEEATKAAKYVDVLQIPAFLARQTELLVAAGETGKYVNIKKGQFMSAESMQFAKEKVENTGNKNILLTERGTFFGYQDLVVDFRSIPVMSSFGAPVVMDVTHSLQQPNQSSGVSGGRPALIEAMGKAALAVGADGLFIETHPNPLKALSDGANMLSLDLLDETLARFIKVREAIT